MRTPAEFGRVRSPTRMPAFASTAARVESSDDGASKSFFAASETNFTLRSGPTITAATPEATSSVTWCFHFVGWKSR